MSFEIKFDYDNDKVYIAQNYPYTYSDLQEYIDSIVCEENTDKVMSCVLCRSNAGNAIYEVDISNFNSSEEEMDAKRAIILVGRVHPNEVQGSWAIEGVIDFLISDDEQAVSLRNKYIFKIIPMQNPDGVIIGNYRHDLTTKNLNRVWNLDDKHKHPVIFHIKQLISET